MNGQPNHHVPSFTSSFIASLLFNGWVREDQNDNVIIIQLIKLDNFIKKKKTINKRDIYECGNKSNN